MNRHSGPTHARSKRRPLLMGALVGTGAVLSLVVFLVLLRTRGPDRQGTLESGSGADEMRTRVAATATLSRPVVAGEQGGLPPSTAEGCGNGFIPAPAGRCRPLNSQTGEIYSDQELHEFDEMRATPFVAEANSFVPKLLTPAEVRERRQLYQQMDDLADRISRRRATPSQIEEYFRFRETLTHYRMQILSYQHARAAGRISLHDPALDPEEITVPQLKARYAALDAESKLNFEQLVRAREAHGLPGHEYQAWGNPPAQDQPVR